MPSKKILVTLIICLAIVASISIWQWGIGADLPNPDKNKISIENPAEKAGDNSNLQNWQDILSTINGTTTSVVPNTGAGATEPTTLTDQIAKDFMGQYLILKQSNGSVTPAEATAIAQNALSSADYTKAVGVQYTAKDLNINSQTSKETAQKYMNDGVQMLTKYSSVKSADPLAILNTATKSGKDSDLAKLDPIIAGYDGIILNSLKMTVPSDAVTFHLALLNAISNVEANIKAMRASFTDPVTTFAALSVYKKHLYEIGVAMQGVNNYFISKGIIK